MSLSSHFVLRSSQHSTFPAVTGQVSYELELFRGVGAESSDPWRVAD